MSVRVAYVDRTGRGLVVRSLRLVAQSSDTSWPQRGAAATDDAAGQNPAIYADIASWLKTSLQSARSRDSLELLCLDASGTIYSWLSASSHDPNLVALLARQGAGSAGVGPSEAIDSTSSETAPVTYFAPSPLDSSVQPLPADPSLLTPPPKPAKGAAPLPNQRIAAIAASDLPARMLVDALDAQGVRVGDVGTIWHAMAVAWDASAARRAGSEATVASSSPVCAVVMIDPSARLLWCWSHEGRLLAGGSIRLRAVPANPPTDDESATEPLCSREDIARLAAEWVSWAVQLSRSPQRVICVLPERLAGTDSSEALRPGEVGEEIAKAWPGASVDAALHDDPLGATLRRVVTHLESTPAATQSDPGSILVAASARPGSAHRSLFIWAAAAVALAAAGLGVLGWRFRQSASQSQEAATLWKASWKEPIKAAFPDLKVRAGWNELRELEALITLREDAGKLPDRVERAKPVMNELEGVSLVLASPTVELKSIKIPTDGQVQVVAISDSTANAEAVLEALKHLGSTELENWSASYRQVAQSERVEGTYSARWTPKGGAR